MRGRLILAARTVVDRDTEPGRAGMVLRTVAELTKLRGAFRPYGGTPVRRDGGGRAVLARSRPRERGRERTGSDGTHHLLSGFCAAAVFRRCAAHTRLLRAKRSRRR